MFRSVVGCVLLFTGIAAAKAPLHVYYYNGEAIEQMTVRGVTVSVSLEDTGKLNQLAVYVDNGSSDAVNVIPANFVLHQTKPLEAELSLKSEQEIQQIAHRGLWSTVAGGVGSGFHRAQEKMSGQERDDGVPTSLEGQARWLAHVDDLGQRGKTGTLLRYVLRSTTVFPHSRLFGVIWFERNQALSGGNVRVTLGTREYLFPLPPPTSATTPANPASHEKITESSDPATGANANSKGGVLGVSCQNWFQGTFRGVQIVDVDQGSPAEMANLRVGYVITEIEGDPINTIDDLAAELAKHPPGTKVFIVYLVHTNLGWMPQKTSVILSVGD
jgi:PDZ domain-containing protein